MDTQPSDNVQLGGKCRSVIVGHEAMFDEARGCCKHLNYGVCMITLAFESCTVPFFATDAELGYWADNCEHTL